VAIVCFGPGLLFTLLPDSHGDLVAGDAIWLSGWGPVYGLIFGVMFAAGVLCLFHGLRAITRPPSFLYRLTHPRLPRWARRRPVWPLS
jgi:hypothetical protein